MRSTIHLLSSYADIDNQKIHSFGLFFSETVLLKKKEIVMPTYISPGLNIEKISLTLPYIEGVETAIPVFIGFTEKTKDENDQSLTNVPVRLKSLYEFEDIFGNANAPEIEVSIKQARQKESGQITVTKVSLSVESGNIGIFSKKTTPLRHADVLQQWWWNLLRC